MDPASCSTRRRKPDQVYWYLGAQESAEPRVYGITAVSSLWGLMEPGSPAWRGGGEPVFANRKAAEEDFRVFAVSPRRGSAPGAVSGAPPSSFHARRLRVTPASNCVCERVGFVGTYPVRPSAGCPKVPEEPEVIFGLWECSKTFA